MHTPARPALTSALLTGMLLLGACGKHDQSATSSTPPVASTAAAPLPAGPAHRATSAPPPAVSTGLPAGATSSTSASPTAGTPAANDSTFRIDSVKLGNKVTASHAIARPMTTFAPSDSSIYASVVTAGHTTGSTLSTRWTYLEGKGQPITTISQTIATDGPATTTFHLQNPNDWPAGKYRVEIAIDGKSVDNETFQVKG